jgi:hypothetical protein
MNLPHSSSPPPNDLVVVGEHREDPHRLLLLGSDANYYEYSIPNGHTVQVTPDGEWKIERQAIEQVSEELPIDPPD